jgi:hypothetical protein
MNMIYNRNDTKFKGIRIALKENVNIRAEATDDCFT